MSENKDDLKPVTLLELVDAGDLRLLQRERPAMKWWRVDRERNLLVTHAGGYDYDLDLDDLDLDDLDDRKLPRAMEKALDWIQHVGGKAWANAEMTGELGLFLSTRIMERVWRERT